MAPDQSLWLGRLFDAVAYAAAVTVAVVAVSAPFSFLLGQGWGGVKYVLFVIGWLAFGYATFVLRPSGPSAGDDEPPGGEGGEVVGGRTETRFQAAVQELPPARFHQLPVDDRLPAGVNIFLASLAMLGTSLALEVVWGV